MHSCEHDSLLLTTHGVHARIQMNVLELKYVQLIVSIKVGVPNFMGISQLLNRVPVLT
jgi:hypothetical protein